MKRPQILSAAAIKLLACLLMFIDHAGMLLFPQVFALRLIGRLAFPLFAFQIAEGYQHTHNLRRYALRLLLFALLSEIPFDLAVTGQIFSLSHQNVLFTLLFGLLACYLIDLLKADTDAPQKLLSLFGIAVLLLAAEWMHTDYGAVGVLTVCLFSVTKKSRSPLLYQTIGIFFLNVICLGGTPVLFCGIYLPVQSFALLSLPLIALYNGKKGSQSKLIQFGCYLFYPLHLLILSLIV